MEIVSIQQLKILVSKEYEKRIVEGRMNTSRRLNSLEHVVSFVTQYFNGETTCFSKLSKQDFYKLFREKTGYRASADKSVITEMYNQNNKFK